MLLKNRIFSCLYITNIYFFIKIYTDFLFFELINFIILHNIITNILIFKYSNANEESYNCVSRT